MSPQPLSRTDMTTKKPTTKKTAGGKPTVEKPAGKVRVRATRFLSEDGWTYAPGDEFETTAKRAAALGKLVAII